MSSRESEHHCYEDLSRVGHCQQHDKVASNTVSGIQAKLHGKRRWMPCVTQVLANASSCSQNGLAEHACDERCQPCHNKLWITVNHPRAQKHHKARALGSRWIKKRHKATHEHICSNAIAKFIGVSFCLMQGFHCRHWQQHSSRGIPFAVPRIINVARAPVKNASIPVLPVVHDPLTCIHIPVHPSASEFFLVFLSLDVCRTARDVLPVHALLASSRNEEPADHCRACWFAA
mmetsp:Transcript_34568/g.64569  ORF Transcript_34568/g.64569 Transcript_34568/m.64569 type:complete len:232 (-) Transcript_34568:1283-1978(-)